MVYTPAHADWGYALSCCGPLAAGQPDTPIRHTDLEHIEQGIVAAHVTADAAVPSTAAGNQLYATNSTGGETTLAYSAFGASLLDDADAAAARATLGTDSVYVNTTGDQTTGDITYTGVSGTGGFSVRLPGDTEDRLELRAGGNLVFGSGSAAPDSTISRTSPNFLVTNSYLESLRTGPNDLCFGGHVTGETFGRWNVNASGTWFWGPGTTGVDAFLGRIGVQFLNTNSAIQSTRPTGSNGFATAVTGEVAARLILTCDGQIRFGSGAALVDTFLYRSAANVLKTDGKFLAAAGIGVGNSAAASALGTLTRKMEVFDAAGASIGFVPIYGSIT